MSTEFFRKYIEIINEATFLSGAKISKGQAHYTDNSPYRDDCDECKHFQEPGSCEIVTGIISPDGWCQYFDKQELLGEDYGPLDEKWGTQTKVSPEEKGKYAGKTKAELLKSYNALKKSGPHKKGSPDYGRMRELAFAIRAKSGWGKVKDE